MNRKSKVSVVAAMAFAVLGEPLQENARQKPSGTQRRVTTYGQDKYSLKSPAGIAFSEFKGYEDWAVVSSARTDEVLKVIQRRCAAPLAELETVLDAENARAPACQGQGAR